MNSELLDVVLKGLTGSFIISSFIEEQIMKKGDTVVEPPVDKVSVIVAAYNEELLIEDCLKSIRNQSVIKQYPYMFEIILADNISTDKTTDIASKYVDKIILTKRGKLNSRNNAIQQATGKIIVSADADCEYDEHWLNTLLKPFQNPKVNAVSGHVLDYSIPNTIGQLNTIMFSLEKSVFHTYRMTGSNSAFKKEYFYKVGMFKTDINQLDIKDIVLEEELDFGKRLSKYGRIIFVPNALCIHHGGLKIGCRNGLVERETCDLLGIGKTRF